MEIVVKAGRPQSQKTGCLLFGACEGRRRSSVLQTYDDAQGGRIGLAAKRQQFTGRVGEVLQVSPAEGARGVRIMVVGLGAEKGLTGERLRQAVGRAVDQLTTLHEEALTVVVDSFATRNLTTAALAEALAEGALLAAYRFDRYRTPTRTRSVPPKRLQLLLPTAAEAKAAQTAADLATAVCTGVTWARDLVNEPGNVKSPAWLAEQAREMATAAGLECTILDRAELEREKMGALLGVAQGSVRDPRLIILRYQGGTANAKPVALVGKGVVFDAGGISLKPAAGMEEMKMDMAGGAAVLGTLRAAAALRLKCNLVGVVPAVENMPSGTAIRPGDILTAQSGKTIEVQNTDAEGRLILADALNYVRRYQPQVVVDLATLTGACIIALGHHATAVLGNDQRLINDLHKAGEASGERIWQLPLWEEYAAQIDSKVADVKNTGGREAGTITAAAFLEKFADDLRWAHLDIAGTAWEEKGRPCYAFGGTGVGVRLLLRYLRDRS
jgi:leucyl aminopeptidase